MRPFVNDRGSLIKAEHLNGCWKTKLTVRQMPTAELFVGAVPRVNFSPAITACNAQNELSELWSERGEGRGGEACSAHAVSPFAIFRASLRVVYGLNFAHPPQALTSSSKVK